MVWNEAGTVMGTPLSFLTVGAIRLRWRGCPFAGTGRGSARRAPTDTQYG